VPAPRSWSLRLPIAFRIALKLDETVAMKFLVVVGLILRTRRSEADGQGNRDQPMGAQMNPHCGG
jgi:hypothetical protein